MEIIKKIKYEWNCLHNWVKVVLIIIGVIIGLVLAVLIADLLTKGFFGFGEWIGRTLKIQGY